MLANHPFAKRLVVDLSECGGVAMALPDDSLTIRGSDARVFVKAKMKLHGVMVTNLMLATRSWSSCSRERPTDCNRLKAVS